MEKEKRNMGSEDPIKLLLAEALVQHRNDMLENFSQILQRLSTITCLSSSRSRFGDDNPLKVQVNFDIPILEGRNDVDALEKWLNFLEGYFFIHNFFDKENITFVFLKSLPHVKHWWETYWEKNFIEESRIFWVEPTWYFCMDAFKEKYYPVGNHDEQYMIWTMLYQKQDQTMSEFTNTFNTLHTNLGIKYSE
jgi:hypothetical protein